MKFSVIIPCKNSAGTINAAIESIRKQKGTGITWEAILIPADDDDPTFDSIEDKRQVKVVKSHRHVDLAESRNLGIDAAKGDIICFLDADDRYENNAFSDVSSIFTTHMDIDTVVGEILLSTPTQNSLFSPDYKNQHTLISKAEKDEFLSSDNLWFQVGALFSRSAFLRESQLRFDNSLAFNEDLLFAVNVVLKTKIVGLLPSPVLLFTASENGAHTNRREEALVAIAFSWKYLSCYFDNNGYKKSANYWKNRLIKGFLISCAPSDRKKRHSLACVFRKQKLLKGLHSKKYWYLVLCFKTFGYLFTWKCYAVASVLKHRKK
jgi:glycosyltransferase involved in cell wall biosynthesis